MPNSPRFQLLACLGALAIPALAALAGILSLRPPKALPAEAPPAVFSAARAWEPLKFIAAEPRPVASPRHAEVRDFLLERLKRLGLEVQVQVADGAASISRAHRLSVGRVENVIARLPGKNGARAVLVVGHYDSVPTGPGASDDGVAVAAMLEVARILRQGPPLENDLLFLFSDGEEAGLLGATAFQEHHPWAPKVSVVLNFEARGSSGAALLFESSPRNGWLVRQIAAALPSPQASSLYYEAYAHLPNSTDFTVFKEARKSGLNFANVGGAFNYHTRLESLEHVDPDTLQHQGEAMLALARHLGNADLTSTEAPDAIYFNVGPLFVHYPASTSLPLLALAALLLLVPVRKGLREGRLRPSAIARGALALLLATATASVLVGLLWAAGMAVLPLFPALPEGESYHSELYRLGFTALALATIVGALALTRRLRPAEVAVAGLIPWLAPTVLTSVWLPGASYLFLGPSLAAMAGVWLLLRKSAEEITPGQVLALGALAGPPLLLAAPIIHTAFIALTLDAAAVVTLLIALLMALLAPLLRAIGGRRLPALAGAGAVIAVAFLAVAAAREGDFDARRPRLSSATYLLDADSSTALWLSPNRLRDPWLTQLLGPSPTYGSVERYYPGWQPKFWMAPAPLLPLEPPRVRVESDTRSEATRTVTLRIASPRLAPVIDLNLDPSVRPRAVEAAGKRLEGDKVKGLSIGHGVRFRFWATPPEGYALTLQLEAESPLRLRVSDHSFDFPELAREERARPADMMAVPAGVTQYEGTRVTRTFEL